MRASSSAEMQRCRAGSEVANEAKATIHASPHAAETRKTLLHPVDARRKGPSSSISTVPAGSPVVMKAQLDDRSLVGIQTLTSCAIDG